MVRSNRTIVASGLLWLLNLGIVKVWLLVENIRERNLALAVLQLLRCCVDCSFNWAVRENVMAWLIIHETCVLARPFVQAWMLIMRVHLVIERLLKSCSNSMKSEADRWFIPGWCTRRLSILLLLLSSLKYGEVLWVSSIFKCSNYWLLDSKFLHWIRRVCSESKLSHMRRVSVFRVRMIRSCRLLWT